MSATCLLDSKEPGKQAETSEVEWWVFFCGCACCSRKRLDLAAAKTDW